MDEDSPWGAPSFPSSSSSPPKPSSSSYSPPSAQLPRFNSSSWGTEDNGGGWGNSTDEQEEYGSFGGDTTEDVDVNDHRAIGRKESVGDAWGAGHDSPELPKLSLPSASQSDEKAFGTSEPLDLDDDSRIQSNGQADVTQRTNEEPEDDRGWAPSTPPLPPISTVEISSSGTSPSSHSTTKPTHTTWDPGSLDEPDLAPPPPLPSVDDLFATSQNNTRKESVGDGEEAWGAATSWEERQEKERMWEQGERDEIEKEIERKVREAEEAAERGEESWGVNSSGRASGKSISAAHVNGLKEDSRNFAKQNWNPATNQFEPDMTPEEPDVLSESVEPPTTEPPISNDTPQPSLFKLTPTLFPNFRAGLDKTAAKSNETLKGTTSSLRNAKFGYTGKEREKDGMTSVEDGNKGHQGDEYDVDAPGRSARAKSSWWGRSGGGDAQKKEEGHETNAVGAQECGEGESGKTEDSQQVGTIGRLFGRFKKNAPAPSSSDAGSARSSGEATRPAKPEQPTWKDEDFDALGSGRLGSNVNQVQQEEQDLDDSLGGFFGDKSAGRGSLKSRSRVPTAPPEDDFGGLLGSFSTAPVKAQTTKSRPNKPFDPFDPLSEPSPARNLPSASLSTLKRPTSNISFPALSATPLHSPSSNNTQDDSFDAFFDSVTSSIPKPPLSSIPTPPLPSSSSSNQRPPSILLPKSTVPKRPGLASPIPRISSASPPIRSPVKLTSPPSSSNPSRATTPILPLAPPPPPSQPLSQRNNLLGGSLAPPPLPSQPISRPVSTSPPPLASSNTLSPISPSASTRASPLNAIKTAPPPPSRGNSGPLSQDDLSFFEGL